MTLTISSVSPLTVIQGQKFDPFTSSGVTFSDTAPIGWTESVTTTLTAAQYVSNGYVYPTVTSVGVLTDPNGGGTFAGVAGAPPLAAAFNEAGLVTGTPTFATTLLDRLIYTAPTLPNGQSEVVLIRPRVLVSIAAGVGDPNDFYPAIVINVVSAPLIAGAVADEPIASGQSISPFATVSITDTDFSGYYINSTQYETQNGSTDSATINITDGGNLTDADGLLTGNGLSKTGTGTYSLAAVTPYLLQSELRSLKYAATAPDGQTINPQFALAVSDPQANLTSKDNITSLLIVGSPPPPPMMPPVSTPPVAPIVPTISGTLGGQQVTASVIDPFAYVTVSDGNTNPSDTVTITLHNSAGMVSDADGTLTGTDLNKTAAGVYTLAADSPAMITSDLNAITFTPTHLASGVASETTTFSLVATNPTVQLSSLPDSKSTLTNTQSLPAPKDVYIFVDDNGFFYVEDTGTAQSQIVSSDQLTIPTGTVVFDPTGNAEDVSRLYQAALARPSDVAGLEYWANGLDIGSITLMNVANAFSESPEFIQDYGSLSDASFVNQLYQNVLGRPADAAGAQSWDAALASGMSRGAVLIGFAESQENKLDTISTAGDENNAEAYRLYQAAFNRAPDAGGLSYWASALANGATPTQVAQDFINSTEFQQDYGAQSGSAFVSTLYQNVLHRAADSAGLQYWTNTLQHGTSTAAVLTSFSDSLENRLQTAPATHANGFLSRPSGLSRSLLTPIAQPFLAFLCGAGTSEVHGKIGLGIAWQARGREDV